MPLPSTWTKINLIWTGVNLDGTVPSGTIEVHSSAPRFYVATPTPTLVLGEKPIIKSVVGGACTIAVPATDDPDVVPNGFTYRIVEKINGRPDKEYYIEVPLAEAPSIDLATIAPVAESLGQPVTLVTYAALEAITGEVDVVAADVADVATDLAALDTRVDTAETDIDNVETELSTTNGAVSALDTRLDTAEAAIVDHEDRIDGLETAPTGEVTLAGEQTLTNKTLGSTKLSPDGGSQFTNLAGRRILGIIGNADASGNNLRINSPGTGISPSLQAEGADTNISLDLVPKGTGVVMIDGVEAADISSTQTLTNKTLTDANLDNPAIVDVTVTGLVSVDGVDINAGWDAYTPVMSGLTTNPTLGNSVLAGQFKRIGKTVHFRIRLTIGSTFAHGSGAYFFSTPSDSDFVVETGIGTAIKVATGPGTRVAYVTSLAAISAVLLVDSAGSVFNSAISVAAGDTIGISGTYEAA